MRSRAALSPLLYAAAAPSSARWTAFCVAVLLALALVAPWIVANSPLKDRFVDQAAEKIDGRVRVDSISLGWFGATRLTGVTLTDRRGETIAAVEEVRIGRSLLSLLADSRDLGEVTLTRPVVSLVVWEGGSNLEAALGPLLNAPSASRPLSAKLVARDGRVDVADRRVSLRETASPGRPNDQATLRDVAATVTLPSGAETPLMLEATALVEGSEQHGRVEISGLWQANEEKFRYSVKTDLERTPASAVAAVARRWVGDFQAVGTVDGGFTVRGTNHELTMETSLTGEAVALACPRWLKTDQPKLGQARLWGTVTLRGDALELTGANFACDVGRISAEGTLPWIGVKGGSQLVRRIETLPLAVAAECDLAATAKQLPQTLRVREDVEIRGGRLQLNAKNEVDAAGSRLTASAQADSLQAVRAGRVIEWPQPLSAKLRADFGKGEFVVRELSAQSDFFTASGRGSPHQGELRAAANLRRLSERLVDFFDLGDLQLDGLAEARLEVTPAADGAHSLSATAELQQCRVKTAGKTWVDEPRLTATVAAQATRRDAGKNTTPIVHTAHVELASGGDHLTLDLREPLVFERLGTTQSLVPRTLAHVSITGEASAWLRRINLFLPPHSWQAAGKAQLAGLVQVTPAEISGAGLKGSVDQLALSDGGSLSIGEPRVEIEGDLRYRFDPAALETRRLSVTSSALAALFKDARVDLSPLPQGEGPGMKEHGRFEASLPRLVGKADVRADLARLAAWYRPPPPAGLLAWQGMAEGQFSARSEGGRILADARLNVRDFAVARLAAPAGAAVAGRPPAGPPTQTPLWQEPEVDASASLEYEPARDTLRFTNATLAAESARFAAAGAVAELSGRQVLDVTGEVEYDLDRVVARLTPLLGTGVRFTGGNKRAFALRGPLRADAVARAGAAHAGPSSETAADSVAGDPLAWTRELTGAASLGWSSGTIYELPVGPGALSGALAQRQARFQPLDIRISGGQLKLAPLIDFTGHEPTLRLAAGQVARDVQITESMCQNWLMYVAPLLAEATRIDGRFSLVIDGGVFPLMQPQDGDVSGVLAIGEGTMRPGPMADRLIFIGQQVKALVNKRPPLVQYVRPDVAQVSFPAQQVAFRMADRGVEHRGLAVDVGGVRVYTSGRVGMDRSLNLIAETPIDDDWIDDDPLLAGLRGQTIRVPISGALSRPTLDTRATAAIARDLLKNAAVRTIEEEAVRGLRRLLGEP